MVNDPNFVKPQFSAKVRVDQLSKNNLELIGVVLFMMVGAALPFFVFQNETVKIIGGLVGAVVACILFFAFQIYWLSLLGIKRFSAEVQVSINEKGINIAELGLVKWPDVLELTSLPDCSYAFVIITRHYEKLLIHANVDKACPIVSHYIKQH